MIPFYINVMCEDAMPRAVALILQMRVRAIEQEED
jgi:hypothetical protein